MFYQIRLDHIHRFFHFELHLQPWQFVFGVHEDFAFFSVKSKYTRNLFQSHALRYGNQSESNGSAIYQLVGFNVLAAGLPLFYTPEERIKNAFIWHMNRLKIWSFWNENYSKMIHSKVIVPISIFFHFQKIFPVFFEGLKSIYCPKVYSFNQFFGRFIAHFVVSLMNSNHFDFQTIRISDWFSPVSPCQRKLSNFESIFECKIR